MDRKWDPNHNFIYEEACQQHRFFLGWRNATVAAIIAVLYFGFSLYLEKSENEPVSKIILLGIGLAVVILWLFEYRTRDLYRAAQNTAKSIERRVKVGAHTAFALQPPRRLKNFLGIWPAIQKKFKVKWLGCPWFNFFELSHSRAIDLLCVLGISSIAFLWTHPKYVGSAAKQVAVSPKTEISIRLDSLSAIDVNKKRDTEFKQIKEQLDSITTMMKALRDKK